MSWKSGDLSFSSESASNNVCDHKKYFGGVFPTFNYGYFKHVQNWENNIINPHAQHVDHGQ